MSDEPELRHRPPEQAEAEHAHDDHDEGPHELRRREASARPSRAHVGEPPSPGGDHEGGRVLAGGHDDVDRDGRIGRVVMGTPKAASRTRTVSGRRCSAPL